MRKIYYEGEVSIRYVRDAVRDFYNSVHYGATEHFEKHKDVADTIQKVLLEIGINTEIRCDGCYTIKYIK